MLVRRYVGKRLADYYNQPSNKVVGSMPENSVRLSSLWGEWHWRRVYQRLYKEQEGQWLTPVELFYPYYSNVLANFCAKTAFGGENLDIVELGGGRGTNARGILTHLQSTQSDLYERIRTYTIVDSSRTLMDLQKQVLGSTKHASKVQFVFQDLMKVAEERASLLERSDVPTVFLATELLDNLAHDKVRRSRTSRRLEQADVRTADLSDVFAEDAGELNEVFTPLEDPLLCQILQAVPSYGGTTLGRPTWVPTVACGILRHLSRIRPNACLAIADFDYLPPPQLQTKKRRSLEANQEPLVTCMKDEDHECYLDAPPLCDILFPTDFAKLASFAKTCFPDSKIATMKQSQFLETYGAEEVNATKSWLTGYSPLIHDFANCSVLTITREE